MARILVALLLLCACFPVLARGRTTEVLVRVDGLSCPFCAYSLEKKLKAIDGVAKLSIDVSSGLATLVPADEAMIDYAGLPRAVQDAGFTPREILVRGTGRVLRDGDALTLTGSDDAPLFTLEPNPLVQGLEANTWIAFEGLVLPGKGGSTTLPRLSLTVATPEAAPDEG